MKNAVTLLLIIAATLLVGFFAGDRHRAKIVQSAPVVRDTVFDTIPVRYPVPYDSAVVRVERVRLPIYDTIRVEVSTEAVADSVDIEIPITQKHYSDSLFDAYVSGYHPSLDSITIYRRTITITKKTDPPRWGVSLQGGYGMTPKGFQPYVGLGVHLTLLP